MRINCILLLLSICFAGAGYPITPESALKRLMDGNDRYAHDALEHPNRTQERREATSAVQTPFAVIVGCSDSRVSPEIIFDEGVGDLFVVRVEGNAIGPLELESIEYAANALKSVLVLVLGHESCGAVNAVVQRKTQDIKALALIIDPAVKQAEKGNPKDLLVNAIKTNALNMKNLLIRSKAIGDLVKQKKIAVEAGFYNLETGVVEIL